MKKNKFSKKSIIVIFAIYIISLSISLLINSYFYHKYNQNYNYKLSYIYKNIEANSSIDKTLFLNILNDKENHYDDSLSKYFIDLDNDIVIENNKDSFHESIYLIIGVNTLVFLILFMYMYKLHKKHENSIKDITNLIDRINNGLYEIDINSMNEDSLSLLRSEIHKTTVKLKEYALSNLNDKVSLKTSLEDISHQLKTPLTSILINVDNLIDNPSMNDDVRLDFLNDIKRNINSINFMVKNLLKLSKFDANTVTFKNEEISISKIIDESVSNVSSLSDLKNVKVNVINSKDFTISCDFKWHVEAITNILKNAIEHSLENTSVLVKYDTNNVYSYIEIKDSGTGIKSEDLPHIFERFYNGYNQSDDSFGIGLALSKTILDKDGAKISVESSNTGTVFTIKYFKV